MKRITITKPDDWHLHVRDNDQMRSVIGESARYYQRALIMPNLAEPVATVGHALSYKERICDALKGSNTFEPFMALYLTANTSISEIKKVAREPSILAVKMFPAGATTNSAFGIQNIDQCDTVFQEMQKLGIPLSVHGEVTDPDVDIFEREKIFINTVLKTIIRRYPGLRIVFEHITTTEAVQFTEESGENLAATITIHHLLFTRNNLLIGGIKPHLYCLPVVKTEQDRQQLLKAATSGNPKFFLGTDSAPHSQKDKEAGIGKAGIYSAPVSLLLYADQFEQQGKLEKLEGFSSSFGADFYRLPRNNEKITLIKEENLVPDTCSFGDDQVVPLMAGKTLAWKLE
ncbi:dihydroorotase [bacterium]|nr:dihydroorotase [bacterium]